MNLIFDFDSTLVEIESLDSLAEICIQGDRAKLSKVKDVTNRGMIGEISIHASLSERLKLIQPKRSDLDTLIKVLKESISPSITALKSETGFFPDNCYVLSGGFIDYVLPVCIEIGFKSENIFANHFVYDGENIVGYDESRLIAQDLGKAHVLRGLNLTRPIVMIGDGYTDLEVKIDNASDYFIGYTESTYRENVVAKADRICNNFYEVMHYIKTIGSER